MLYLLHSADQSSKTATLITKTRFLLGNYCFSLACFSKMVISNTNSFLKLKEACRTQTCKTNNNHHLQIRLTLKLKPLQIARSQTMATAVDFPRRWVVSFRRFTTFYSTCPSNSKIIKRPWMNRCWTNPNVRRKPQDKEPSTYLLNWVEIANQIS